MNIDRDVLAKMLLSAAALLKEKADTLSEIDSRFGDGDHGVTILKIAGLIEKEVPLWKEETMADFLDNLGMVVMEVKGGSAGPLYGTAIGGLGRDIAGLDSLDGKGAAAMLEGSLSEMEDLTTARTGDKTMMDALIPAALAAGKAEGDARAVWEAAAEAAEKGAEESKNYVARYGRAKSYKEKTIGTPDAGAVSLSLFLRGMAEGMK